MIRPTALLLGLLAAATAPGAAPPLSLTSPNGRLRAELRDTGHGVTYRLHVDGRPLIADSPIGLTFQGVADAATLNAAAWRLHAPSPVRTIDETWRPVVGKRARARNHYRELAVTLEAEHPSRLAVRVVLRLYDDGLAFRQVVGVDPTDRPALAGLGLADTRSAFHFVDDLAWWSYRIERAPAGPTPASRIDGSRAYPLVTETPAGLHVALLEAHLRNLVPMTLSSRPGERALRLEDPRRLPLDPLPCALPWRVVMVGDRAGDLIDSDLITNLNPQADPADFAWLKPGLTFWDWRAWGYRAADGFTYGLDLPSWKRFVDFAAETGIPYLLLDANWYGDEFSPGSDPITGGKSRDVRAAIAYGRERGVGLILYLNHVAAVKYGIERIIPAYAAWGARGIKYGFMRLRGVEKTRWTHKVAALCAQHHLIVNFHDGPLPPTGEEATWPNFVHREFCHAQSDAKRAFGPTDYINMVHVNMLAGPIDQDNGLFDLDRSAAERPKIFAQVPSTILAEAARTLITYGGGMSVLPDAADSYRRHPELFRFIAAQHLPWTDSRTLDSHIGECVCMMRRSGETYLVASVTNERARTLVIRLDFLPPDRPYRATIFADTPTSHYQRDRESYTITHRRVTTADRLEARLGPGSGHCILLEPAAF